MQLSWHYSTGCKYDDRYSTRLTSLHLLRRTDVGTTTVVSQYGGFTRSCGVALWVVVKRRTGGAVGVGNVQRTRKKIKILRCMHFCSECPDHIYDSTVKTWKVKGKVFPHSLPSVGPGADPGVQAVSPQVTWSESRHRPGSRLPLLSARPAVTSVAFTRWRYL